VLQQRLGWGSALARIAERSSAGGSVSAGASAGVGAGSCMGGDRNDRVQSRDQSNIWKYAKPAHVIHVEYANSDAKMVINGQ